MRTPSPLPRPTGQHTFFFKGFKNIICRGHHEDPCLHITFRCPPSPPQTHQQTHVFQRFLEENLPGPSGGPLSTYPAHIPFRRSALSSRTGQKTLVFRRFQKQYLPRTSKRLASAPFDAELCPTLRPPASTPIVHRFQEQSQPEIS